MHDSVCNGYLTEGYERENEIERNFDRDRWNRKIIGLAPAYSGPTSGGAIAQPVHSRQTF